MVLPGHDCPKTIIMLIMNFVDTFIRTTKVTLVKSDHFKIAIVEYVNRKSS